MKLRVENISKTFGSNSTRKIVLNDISFGVNSSQFVTLIGPSGCGKTTLLTIIAGFQPASNGRVFVDGKEVSKPGPDRGFVFQNYALFPWMNVKDNILYPMKQLKVPSREREKRLDELLAMAKLNGSGHLFPHQLSGGMKQRTAVVRALACQPQVLLMDEPLGAVDLQMRLVLQEELEAIWLKNKTTVLMVTHSIEEAIYLSDRVLVMSSIEGKVIEDLEIDLPRPRDRKEDRYHHYEDKLMDLLRIASGREEEQEPSKSTLRNKLIDIDLKDIAQ